MGVATLSRHFTPGWLVRYFYSCVQTLPKKDVGEKFENLTSPQSCTGYYGVAENLQNE